MGARRRQPSEDFDEQVDALAAAFGATAAAISTAILAEAGARAGAAGARAGVSATNAAVDTLAVGIDTALSALQSAASSWINANIPAVYRRGLRDATNAIGGEGAPGAGGEPAGEGDTDTLRREADAAMERLEHRNAIEAAARVLDAELRSAIDGIGRDADRKLGEIRRANVARALAQDAPLANAIADDFADEMRDRGIKFKDRSGRSWDSEAYARMVLRTNVAAVLNAGHLNRAIELGGRYVRVFDGGPGDVDEPCIRANGQVWHIAVAARNMLEHPNCRRSFAALDPTYSGPVDRDLDEVQTGRAA